MNVNYIALPRGHNYPTAKAPGELIREADVCHCPDCNIAMDVITASTLRGTCPFCGQVFTLIELCDILACGV